MKTDWVAEVFSAMRDCGEDISIIYGQIKSRLDINKPQWYELQHNEFDGISGLAEILRGQGFKVDKLPVIRNDKLTFFRRIRGIITVLPAMRSIRRQWLKFDGNLKTKFLPVNERVAWHIFTEVQTKKIIQKAKLAGVTVNTYLLFYLDKVVSSHLMPPTVSRRWMIPVNLRGAVDRESESAPHMSFLGVDFHRNMSLSQLQSSINRLREQAYHWGAWIMMQIGQLVGARAMRRDIINREKKQHGWTGLFSNIGIWDIPGSGHWVFCPAVSRVCPVGAGCLTMNGRMALTIQLHDAFDVNLQTSISILNTWSQACLQEEFGDKPNVNDLALAVV